LLRAIADAQLQPSTDVDAEVEGHAMALKSERYIEGLHYRAIKSLGVYEGQAVSALTFCIPEKSSPIGASGASQMELQARAHRR
jgi:hypothetical protein